MEVQLDQLRSGNLLRVDNDFLPLSGCNAGKLYIKGVEWNHKNAHPIPLTIKWLIKFGFTGWTQTAFKSPHGHGMIIFKEGKFCMEVGLNGYSKTYKYVHQLQNLYYWVTGHELIISELDLIELKS